MNITNEACAAAQRSLAGARSFLRACGAVALTLCMVPAWGADPHTVLVFAAASLTNALEDVDHAFTDQTHIPVKESFASSAVIAKQIASGAPAEVFVSADVQWMDYLEKQHLLLPGTRQRLLGNALVLIAPADSPVHLRLTPHMDLVRALGGGRLAIGEPMSVPAGIYGRQALEKLGVWSSVSDHLAPAESVRSALAFVARGESPLGIVYKTDALAQKRVRIVATFPEDTHPPITYPAARLQHSTRQSAQLLAFYKSSRAREIFQRYGFQVLK